MNLSVPIALEDSGLTVYEFRVYCHLAALEQTQQPTRNTLLIAEACQVSERQVRRAITSLLEQKLIRVTARTQQVRCFSLTAVPEWSVRHHRPTAFEPNRPASPTVRPEGPDPQPKINRPTRPEPDQNPVKHAELEIGQNPTGLPDRPQSACQTGLDLEEEGKPFNQKQDLSSTSTSLTPAYQTVRPDRPACEARTKLLEEAGLLDAALEVCASPNHAILEHRLAALELDLTRLGRGKIARALHTSLENATHSRWGYYKAVLATQATRDQVASQTGVVQTACQTTPAPPAPVKRQKTMAELLATTPLNGTWGR